MTDQGESREQPRTGESRRRSERSNTSDVQGQQRDTRSQARTSRPQDSNQGNRQFLFIDHNADRGTSGEAVRVHVMREAHRSRRERGATQTQSRSRRVAAQDEMVILDFRSTSGPASVTPPVAEESPSQALNVAPIDWPSVVRAGTSQFSLDSMRELHRLAEGYLRSVQLLRPDVLHLCRGDFLSMCAYLAIAALQLAATEREPANVASVQFESRALELLRLRITQPIQMHTDNTIIAVLLLSQLELKDNAESARFHRSALQKLISDRGGLQALQEQNADLYNILLENDFVENDE